MNNLDPDIDLPDSPDDHDNRRRIGRFMIDHLLGRGGMGEVYKAWDSVNDRSVALKILDIRGYEDPDTLRRFQRESEAALVLDHTNIARFYGAEKDDQGHPVIVMEYIRGRGLDTVLDEEPDLPFSLLVDFVIQTARGLENACRRSIIHRDIKPGNLLVDSEWHLKIIDFGLAKSMWDNTSLTSSGIVVGTPRYISPEQGMGRNVDHRSDIYSLGATFYELMTRQTPFEGDTPLSIMMKHISAPLVPPYLVNPRVPADISDVITKMMEKDPSHRYQDYEPLIRDLESAKIHRLAKERRTTGQLSGMNTVILPENIIGGDGEHNTGSSYLTEGLVNIELPASEEQNSSHVKLVFLSLAGMAVLTFAAIFLTKPIYMNSGESSTLGKSIAGFFTKARQKIDNPPTQAEISRLDQQNINATRARMDAVVSRILKIRESKSAGGVSTIAQLRTAGIFTGDQTRDAWGNDFFITDSGGMGTLVAPGRDGLENTGDDFRLSLDGSEQIIPPALSPGKGLDE